MQTSSTSPKKERTVYLNGKYIPEGSATVSIFDRGFLFADGIYEVTSVLNGKLIDFKGHVARMGRSLSELDMVSPICDEDLLEVHRELVRVNNINEGVIYLQITRGSAGDRDFVFPDIKYVKPTIVLFTQSKPQLANSPAAKKGMKVISIDDNRWGRCDIKTLQLLYSSMGKMAALAAGVDDAWMVDEDGNVTEGTNNNAYIIKGNKIITRHLSNAILHGITRKTVLRFAREADMEVEERSFTIEEAQGSDEAFITSASTFVMPVVEIDGMKLGNGSPGVVTARLREIYLEESLKSAL